MVVRVFRAKARPGMEDELAQLIETVSIPFVDGHSGLVARYAGRGIGRTNDELLMISVWESVDAMKAMTGDDWEKEVIPDEREAERIETSSVEHYQTIG